MFIVAKTRTSIPNKTEILSTEKLKVKEVTFHCKQLNVAFKGPFPFDDSYKRSIEGPLPDSMTNKRKFPLFLTERKFFFRKGDGFFIAGNEGDIDLLIVGRATIR